MPVHLKIVWTRSAAVGALAARAGPGRRGRPVLLGPGRGVAPALKNRPIVYPRAVGYFVIRDLILIQARAGKMARPTDL